MEDKLHYIQDAMEAYAVYKLTSLAESYGLSTSNDSNDKYTEFQRYCDERNINPSTYRTGKVYHEMFENHLPKFFDALMIRFPNSRFDFIDVEREFRNQNMKGDFVIKVSGDHNETISVSLKAYKGGFGRIQVCSGTFNSFITNFLFEPAGVGMFMSPDGVRFKGSNTVARDREIRKLGYENIISEINKLDDILTEVKDYFVRDDLADNYFNIGSSGKTIAQEWSDGHTTYGNRGIDISLNILRNNFSDSQIKNRLVKMVGFDGNEELLLLDKKRWISSVTSDKMMRLINLIRSDETTVNYGRHGKSIRFDFVNDGDVILQVDVPFCLDKNGAWWLPKDKKPAYKKKDKCVVQYGQRRPKKSKELSLSTNTYVNIIGSGVLS